MTLRRIKTFARFFSGRIRPMAACRTLYMRLLWTLSLLAISLAACIPVAALSNPIETATNSPVPTVTLISYPIPTETPTPTLTPTPRTPPALPAPYQNDRLTPYGTPHPYIQDVCQYLQDKWSSANSAAGTVVMTIMFHSITREAVTSPDQISEFNFRLLMDALHDNGFQAITTAQLLGFMETNAKIPERSVLLVVDDRRTSQYYDAWFRQYWENWKWPVVNAWISTDQSSADLWQQQADLEKEGWVDHQAHGFQHLPPLGPDSTDEYILQELQKPIEAFQEHFNKTPIAIIWPGGGFTPHSVVVARDLGYRLGFTTNPRGPVMFNWVPLADMVDGLRPTWIPEGSVLDPLMVLPRFWDTDAILHIEDVIQAGQEAAAYAEQNKATELDYYDIVCAPKYGPIP